MILRKTDWGLILTCLLVGEAVWRGYSKPASWDQAKTDIEAMKPRVENDEHNIDANAKEIVGIKSVQTVQMALVLRELDSMHRDIRDIKRQGDGR